MNQNTVVDYESMADERATASGRRDKGRGASSYVRLIAAILGALVVLVVISLALQAGGAR